ncbi:transcription initiation protein [Inquilinus sp. KBS0705]|nr:transcription initiation protein [Inquilinus sp. KBS0705]
MKDFLLIFRSDNVVMAEASPEEREAMTKKWMDWVVGIATQGNLTDRGNRLHPSGKVMKGGQIITNGPYTEIKEFVGGYSIIKAESYEAAVEIAKDCPIFLVDGSLEVREVSPM